MDSFNLPFTGGTNSADFYIICDHFSNLQAEFPHILVTVSIKPAFQGKSTRNTSERHQITGLKTIRITNMNI